MDEKDEQYFKNLVADGVRQYTQPEWHEVPWSAQKVSIQSTWLGQVEIPSWNAGAPDNIDPRVLPDYLRTILFHLMKLEKQVVAQQAATAELAKGNIDPARLEQIIDNAVAKSVEITGTVEVHGTGDQS